MTVIFLHNSTWNAAVWYEKGVLFANLEWKLAWTRLHNKEVSKREFDTHHSSFSKLKDEKYFDAVFKMKTKRKKM